MTKENQLEENLIKQLTELKYSYNAAIVDRKTLEQNFKNKFETLNRVKLTDNEFLRLREEIIEPDVFAASKLLRERQYFQREDGTPLHYTLVHIKDWCKNDFEVISQLRINTENSHQRYDIILLINGLPVVQIELKKLDISPRKAMQQIVDYKNEPGNGYSNSLLCFMQLFIVSNRSSTFYFANNKTQHFQFNAEEQFLPVYELADIKNQKIRGLHDFTEKFLTKCTLGEMISKYMVLLESEQKLLVMRPYQIYAVKAIVDCIHQNRGNGFIWHTTGSGKTLTSFKASTTNTEALVRRLLSTDYADKVIVTTIQKLGLALDGTYKNPSTSLRTRTYKERLEPLRNKRVVFIFDECHRSQFGENHKAIKEFFPNAQLFGFTGTPIFPENASSKQIDGEEKSLKTTEDIFKQRLHAYTITHAIEDRNVLKFHIDYFKGKGSQTPKPGEPIAQKAVTEAIINKHNAATNHRKFNAILATASINNAIEFYQLFKDIQQRKQAENPDYIPLTIACVFSPPAQLIAKNGDQNSQRNAADIKQLQEDLAQEKADNQQNPEEKKEALKTIIADYNLQYSTNHSINEFDSYYQDVQRRIKDHKYTKSEVPVKDKIDITIVVDMLLTGFDSKYLNTLYVDKNLKYHGLIQAFSRTNRILNDTKPYGNILDFRSQQDAVNQAIALFSGEDSARAKEIWMVDPAPVVIEHYQKAVQALGVFMQDHNLVNEPQEAYNLKGDAARVDFVKKFKEVQKLKVALDQYTDINEEQEAQIEAILPTETLLEFRSSYIETAKQLRKIQQKEGDHASENIQQLDFEFVLFASSVIDYDYIMSLIADSTQQKPTKQKMTKAQVISLLSANANMMDVQEDLTDYITSLDWNSGQDVTTLRSGYETFVVEKDEKELAAIAHKYGLQTGNLKTFIANILSRMIFDGEKLTDLLAPLELSWKERRVKELALMEDLVPQLKKIAQGREISGLAAYE
jgi:type I restriction enzyme R subunit